MTAILAKPGITNLELKAAIRNGKSNYANHPELGKRVDTSVTRLSTNWNLVAKRGEGWYVIESID